ncbi:MAG: hypothetical protein GY822_03600 [Deltaproteobacteria bacterium]|nr:hypothetical protein [Deltaproteobacteria bacterium]
MGTVLPFQPFASSLEPKTRLVAPLPGIGALPSFNMEVRTLDFAEADALFSDAQVLQSSLLDGLLEDLQTSDGQSFATALDGIRTAALGLLDEDTERSFAQAVLAQVLSGRSHLERRMAALALSEIFGALAADELTRLADLRHDDVPSLSSGLLLCLQAEPGEDLLSDAENLLEEGGANAEAALLALLQCGVVVTDNLQDLVIRVARALSEVELRRHLPSLLALVDEKRGKLLLDTLIEQKRLLCVFHALRFAPHLIDDSWLAKGLGSQVSEERCAALSVMERHPHRKWLTLLMPQMQDQEPRFRRQLQEVMSQVQRVCRPRYEQTRGA